MKKPFDKRVTVTVYMEQREYDLVQQRCRPAAVSALVRSLLQDYLQDEGGQAVPMVETKIRRAANRSSAPAAAPAVPEKPRGSYATVCESNPEHHPRCSCDKCKTKRGPAA